MAVASQPSSIPSVFTSPREVNVTFSSFAVVVEVVVGAAVVVIADVVVVVVVVEVVVVVSGILVSS